MRSGVYPVVILQHISVTRGGIEPLTCYMWDVLEGVLCLGKINVHLLLSFPGESQGVRKEVSEHDQA